MAEADVCTYFATLAMSNMVSTEDLLLLMAAHTADKLIEEKPHEAFEKLDIDNFSNAQCSALFCFDKDDLVMLMTLSCCLICWPYLTCIKHKMELFGNPLKGPVFCCEGCVILVDCSIWHPTSDV